MPVVLVTGCSAGGIGNAVARLFAEKNYQVVATLIDRTEECGLEKIDNIHIMPLDITSPSINQTILNIQEKFGSIDILINNAGIGYFSAPEQLERESAELIVRTNLLGTWYLTQAVLPIMHKQEKGRIISVSSLSGVIGFPFSELYSASKGGVEVMMEALAATQKPLGIQISLIEAGPVKTNFLKTAIKSSPPLAPNLKDFYQEMYNSQLVEGLSTYNKSGQSPDEIAKVVFRAVEDEKPLFRYQTSEFLKNIVGHKLVDPSGLSAVTLAARRLPQTLKHSTQKPKVIVSFNEVMAPNIPKGIQVLAKIIASKANTLPENELMKCVGGAIHKNAKILSEFKTAEATEENVAQAIITTLEKDTGVKISLEEFNDAWLAMLPTFSEYKNFIDEAATLNKDNKQQIILLFYTNSKAYKHFTNQIIEAKQEHTLDLEGYVTDINGVTVLPTFLYKMREEDLLAEMTRPFTVGKNAKMSLTLLGKSAEKKPVPLTFVYGKNRLEIDGHHLRLGRITKPIAEYIKEINETSTVKINPIFWKDGSLTDLLKQDKVAQEKQPAIDFVHS